MSEARIACPFCPWVGAVNVQPAREDQQLYGAAQEHIQASHYVEAKRLREMTGKERYNIIMAGVK